VLDPPESRLSGNPLLIKTRKNIMREEMFLDPEFVKEQ
jgi:hypothetical protein